MAELFTLDNLFTLGMLIFLQAVLGFDNLLYISLESKRVPPEQAGRVRKVGIGLAIILRIVLLVVVLQAIEAFQEPFFKLHLAPVFEAILAHDGAGAHRLAHQMLSHIVAALETGEN